ncbi:ribonuclease Z [Gramella sp. AN32]|uniref:Ribonuclease Z n=1 Tax=Christiangramia antarctica TaxID=2058158 RepID=A0ABW5X494_9FLAO|nr:ribonuclease Z [Gramella sp. AN32]MCM4158032.1 ribonuclease Z [Gramella sp. AN32]
MKLTRKDKYLLITSESEELTAFISNITKAHNEFKEENVIFDISQFENLSEEDFLGFLEISSIHREGNKSFVIINNSLSIDELPEELVVVPSLQEAEDIIQMDDIQRDLGF